jgi:prepilin-type N-terminal cleavage/methylation domain-containing protein
MDKTTHGFTLIETLIVVSLAALCASLLFVDLNSYRRSALRDEQLKLVTLLSYARAQAMNNVHQSAHGALLASDGYTLFVGKNFSSADHKYDEKTVSEYPIAFGTSTPREIVFAQLSGDANYDGTIEMIDPTRNTSALITINHEGAVGW